MSCFNDKTKGEKLFKSIQDNELSKWIDFAESLQMRAKELNSSFKNYIHGELFPTDVKIKYYSKCSNHHILARKLLRHVAYDQRGVRGLQETTCPLCCFDTLDKSICLCGKWCLECLSNESNESDANDHCIHHRDSSEDYIHHVCRLCGLMKCKYKY